MRSKIIVIILVAILSTGSHGKENLSLNNLLARFMFQFDKSQEEKNDYIRAEMRASQSVYFTKNSIDKYINTEFSDVFTNADYYILSDDLDSLKAVIKRYSDKQIQVLLSEAAYYGTVKTVKYLIKISKDINKPGDRFGGPPVLSSAGRLDITKVFIANGADLDLTNAYCLGLLDLSIMNGDEEYILALLDEKITFSSISSLVKEKIDSSITSKKLKEYLNNLPLRNCNQEDGGGQDGEL